MPTTPAVELRNASCEYASSPPVSALNGADLVILPGDYLAITGPSGSGKSTLLNLLGLLARPTGGEVWFEGRDTGKLSERERSLIRAHRLGFVFQSYNLLPHRSALQNVELGTLYQGRSRSGRRAIATEVLESVGLGHRREAFPGELSGGERQRVAIARAVSAAPSLLLCDEPTGSLDSSSSAQVLDVLEQVNNGGMALVIVTHSEEVAARAKRQVTVHDGCVRSRENNHPWANPRALAGDVC